MHSILCDWAALHFNAVDAVVSQWTKTKPSEPQWGRVESRSLLANESWRAFGAPIITDHPRDVCDKSPPLRVSV
jgi:hypothetical protein